MFKKLIATVTAAGLSVSVIHPSSAATWRSPSGKTVLPNLDSICWGNSRLDEVQTVFGGSAYSGRLSFDYIKMQGCFPGDTLRGSFDLYTSSHRCYGTITVTWKSNNNAYLEWDIANAGLATACPVGGTTHWEINTYPVAQQPKRSSPPAISPAGTAIVFHPPSNVRATPNGKIICSVRATSAINIYGSTNGWYRTDACGTMGYIHQSQIVFR